MTTPFESLSLLDAMDVAADLLRATICDCGAWTATCWPTPRYSDADDQIVFRKLQKERLPGLDREQFQTLFAEWQERYTAKAVQDRERAIANIMAFAEEYAKINPPSPLFRCVCGAETKDPMDPEFMRIHKPHCELAAEARLKSTCTTRPI